MAGKLKETKEVVETKEVAIEKSVENNEILELLKTMQQQLAESQRKQQELQSKLDKVEQNKSNTINEQYGDEYIKIVHLLQGGTSLESTNINIRFEELFETWEVQKQALKEMVKNQTYKKIFQDVGIYICDRNFIKENQLDKFYDKYQVNEDTFNEMLDMDYNQLQAKLSILPEDLQYSFKIFVIDEHRNRNPKAESRVILDALSAFFKIDIYQSLR